MPHAMITNVATGGSAIIHQVPASRPRRLAPPSAAPAWPGPAWPAVTGGVLGEDTAQYLPVGLSRQDGALRLLDTIQPEPSRGALGPSALHDPGGFGAPCGKNPPGSWTRAVLARVQLRMARMDSRREPIVARTALGS